MELLDGLLFVVGLLIYFLLLLMLSAGIIAAMTGLLGLAGGVLSVPLLYVLPDVRQFLVRASGGRPDEATPTWRVVLRPRYLLLSAVFGVSYGFAVVVLLDPLIQVGLFPGAGEVTPGLVVIPVVFTGVTTLVAYGAHRLSSTWPAGASKRGVFAQWLAFVGVVTTAATAVALLVWL
ncbi:hypothetical protein [Haloarcula laminariae]|uniref:hypothetical protein n=1 Tax=Haloarcula laminariae TaxID=2961577 RepID=UPI002405AA08|nr:hypothetical protein [Halomicroarcula sp. FL173]